MENLEFFLRRIYIGMHLVLHFRHKKEAGEIAQPLILGYFISVQRLPLIILHIVIGLTAYMEPI